MDEQASVSHTLAYYDTHAEEYSLNTLNADLSEIRNAFTTFLSPGDCILDLGCGSGRDTKAFLENGFEVTATDGSAAMCEIASRNTGTKVLNIKYQDLDFHHEFDGVFACSSLLHIPSDELPVVFERIYESLKSNGVFFCCFKKGKFEGFRDGRHYTDLEKECLTTLLSNSGFVGLRLWETTETERKVTWINAISRKH